MRKGIIFAIVLTFCVLQSLNAKTVDTKFNSNINYEKIELNGRESPIKHLVVLMMENRSFDHILGWLKQLNSEIDGLDGSEYNPTYLSETTSDLVYVNQNGYNESPDDPHHDFENTTRQLFGVYYPYWLQNPSKTNPLNNGFVHNAYISGHNLSNPMSMFTIDNSSAPVLNNLAMEFAVIDQWFASIPGPTDPNRGYVMSATSNGMIENFNGTLWSQQSYFDFLTQHGISWNGFYQDDPWGLFYFDDIVNNQTNRRNMHHLDRFFENIKKGELAQFTFLQPRMNPHINGPPTWQHPDALVSEGEQLIKEIYEALRGSDLWNELAFVVIYDECGGFFDHVAPPQEGIPSPDNVTAVNLFNFDRLGIRVPAVIISPWVEKGTVVHDPSPIDSPSTTSKYYHTSVMATANYIFGIDDHLTARDEWSGRFASLFQTRSTPRDDCPMKLPEVSHKSTYLDIEKQRAKPLNDHQSIQVRYYCQMNHPNDKMCGRDVITQGDSELFLQRELPILLRNLEKNSS